MEPILMDFHSHILPGVDHGAKDFKESLSFLTAAKQAGIETVVATSHFYPHEHAVKHFLACRNSVYRKLTDACRDQEFPQILVGAEVLLCAGLENMEDVEQLCIEGTNTILLELPFTMTEDHQNLYDSIEALLREKNLTVVLAHPNRYETKVIERALALGCFLQLNAEDILRLRERARIKKWLREEIVVAVGSDIHHERQVYRKFKKCATILGDAVSSVNQSASMLTNPIYNK